MMYIHNSVQTTVNNGAYYVAVQSSWHLLQDFLFSKCYDMELLKLHKLQTTTSENEIEILYDRVIP